MKTVAYNDRGANLELKCYIWMGVPYIWKGVPYIWMGIIFSMLIRCREDQYACNKRLTTPFTGLINHSLLSSVYSEEWKLAEIIPILKEGDHEQAPNNRPISLLSIFSKISEKVVLNQYSEYLQRYKILFLHQSGNKRNHSTETLNTYITDNILKQWTKRK